MESTEVSEFRRHANKALEKLNSLSQTGGVSVDDVIGHVVAMGRLYEQKATAAAIGDASTEAEEKKCCENCSNTEVSVRTGPSPISSARY